MTETSAAERRRLMTPESVEKAPPAHAGTPILVWILYVLGILAATVLVASLVFVGFAYATSGSGAVGLNVSVPALLLWLCLVLASGATFLWRRSGKAP
jgi:hypothetical protein